MAKRNHRIPMCSNRICLVPWEGGREWGEAMRIICYGAGGIEVGGEKGEWWSRGCLLWSLGDLKTCFAGRLCCWVLRECLKEMGAEIKWWIGGRKVDRENVYDPLEIGHSTKGGDNAAGGLIGAGSKSRALDLEIRRERWRSTSSLPASQALMQGLNFQFSFLGAFNICFPLYIHWNIILILLVIKQPKCFVDPYILTYIYMCNRSAGPSVLSLPAS